MQTNKQTDKHADKQQDAAENIHDSENIHTENIHPSSLLYAMPAGNKAITVTSGLGKIRPLASSLLHSQMDS